MTRLVDTEEAAGLMGRKGSLDDVGTEVGRLAVVVAVAVAAAAAAAGLAALVGGAETRRRGRDRPTAEGDELPFSYTGSPGTTYKFVKKKRTISIAEE